MGAANSATVTERFEQNLKGYALLGGEAHPDHVMWAGTAPARQFAAAPRVSAPPKPSCVTSRLVLPSLRLAIGPIANTF
jgi:hypothetical protein